jgi:hypothetical protein
MEIAPQARAPIASSTSATPVALSPGQQLDDPLDRHGPVHPTLASRLLAVGVAALRPCPPPAGGSECAFMRPVFGSGTV